MSTTEKKLKAKMAKLRQEMKELKAAKLGGCLRFDETGKRWAFSWREDGKQKNKYFPVAKLGARQAKKMAEEYRAEIFPPKSA